MATMNSGHHGMKRIFRKISYCFVFLSRINGTLHVRNHSQQVSVHHSHSPGTKHTSNFRVASLCFLFLRRLHAFEGRTTQISSSFHTKQNGRKRKSLPSTPKCTCCNLKTGSATSDEQTKTILTHTLRELVPKLSRICIGQNPYSSSQIWTADKKPPGWPSENGIKWKDPNNNPKDSLEVLQKKMSVLLEMCKTKNIPVEYQREIKAYLNVCEDLKSNDTPDISSLQILRQQRKKSHELALACRHFSEMVKWHGAPERSTFLENELINLCLVLQKANADRMLNAQFEEVYCAIAQAEGTHETPGEFMKQFNSTGRGPVDRVAPMPQFNISNRGSLERAAFQNNHMTASLPPVHSQMTTCRFPNFNSMEVTMTETSEFNTPHDRDYRMDYMDCDKRQATADRIMMHKRVRGNRYSEDMILN
ncbi:uncharacterized protein LOC125680857 [Ostrea edulis]|uniref:uncharacterized protein LOC125680857 n=1 Tax=Ostrea edulis TaxID=37623 RepID=UPI0020944425|nr:uncharacterized protein LOC125680857 [Ostrea edulis]